ncbi:MAG: lipocalin-like domain-containing protein [Acidobacteriota bacterium]
MRSLRRVFLPLAGALALAAGACGRPPAPAADSPAALSPVAALGGDPGAGWRRAIAPREFRFPEDHGPHEGFRTEWWYFTGNLDGPAGERFGFQLTFFRQGLDPSPAERSSALAADHLMFAHFALADVRAGEFHAAQRIAREAPGLAAASVPPLAVQVLDWSAASEPGAVDFPLRLRAADSGRAIDLVVVPERPVVLQGDDGLSRKGPKPGDASYYYSITRMRAEGTVVAGGRSVPVRGRAWLDREWSTSVLGEGQVGWDWFALQLDDGSDITAWQLRRADGSRDPHGALTLVGPSGAVTRFDARGFRLVPGRTWRSPRSGASYPVAWRLEVPAAGLELDVTAALDAQELRLAVVYWEGAVDVRGWRADREVAGRGFLEMTGYAALDGPRTAR